MSAESLFRQIAFVDTTLAMDGIIPSLSQCHDRLGRLIVALDSALCEKSVSTASPKQFCLLLCHLVDQRISNTMAKNHHNQPYLTLAQSLYGVRERTVSRQAMLSTLLETSTGEVLQLSKTLLPWLTALEGNDEQTTLLAARWAEPEPIVIPERPVVLSDVPEPKTLRSRVLAPLVWFISVFALLALWFCLKAN